MKWRYQLPAHSPIRAGGLVRGLQGLGGDRALRAVEQWILTTLSARQVLLTDSGTSALSLAMRAVGSPIALPAFGCYDLATAADGADAKILLYDLDPTTLGPEPGSLDKAIKAGAKAVVGVHYYGIPSTLISSPTAPALIEDAAQAVGGAFRGTPLGAFGSLSVLSFGRGKGLTGGGGGALVANDEAGTEVLHRVSASLSPGRAGGKSWVRSVAQWMFSRPSLYGIPAALPFLALGETEYRPPHTPSRMDSASAGILADSTRLIDAEVARRRIHARRLLEAARGVRALEAIREPEGSDPGYLRLPMIASDAARAAATTGDARRLGIMPGYPQPLSGLSGFETRIVNRSEPMPGAQLLARRLITLPVHGLLGKKDLLALEGWMRSLS